MGDMFNNVKNKLKNYMQLIKKAVKFFTTAIGQIVGWLIIIAMLLFVIYILITVASVGISRLSRIDDPGVKEDVDYAIFQEMIDNGYQELIPSELTQDFTAYEYAVLMDVAKCIEQNGFTTAEITRTYNFDLIPEYNQPLARELHIERNYYDDSIYKEEAAYELGIGGSEVIPYNKEKDPETGGTEKTTDYMGKIVYQNKTGEYTRETSSLVPYLQIVKEQKDFYYLIETEKMPKSTSDVFYPLMYVERLNKNNSKLWTAWDWQEPIFEANKNKNDLKPQIFDLSHDDDLYKDIKPGAYTWSKVYKIPVKILVERYMPAKNVLSSWYMLKRAEAGAADYGEVEGIIEALVEEIKKIYDYYCLSKEKMEGDVAKTNNQTFINFSWAKLEATNFGKWEERAAKRELYTYVNFWSIFRIYAPWRGTDWEDGAKYEGFGEFQFKGTKIPGILDVEIGTKETHPATGMPFYAPPKTTPSGTKFVVERGHSTISHPDAPSYTYNYIDEKEGLFRRLDLENQLWILYPNQKKYVAEHYWNIEVVTLYFADDREKYPDAPESIQRLLKPEWMPPGNIWPDYEEKGYETEGVYLMKKRPVAVEQEIRYRYMPGFFITDMETWARSSVFDNEIIINKFVETDPRYIMHKNKKARGITNITLTEDADYRIDIYDKVFGSNVRENDVIAMLIEWEELGYEGYESAYTHIRDLYKLIQYCKKYGKSIPEDSYKYVHVPDEIIDYDEPMAQAIFWTERLAVQGEDELTAEEELSMRGKKFIVTWQQVEYEKYPECNNMVYALFPLGSPFARSMYMLASDVKTGSSQGDNAHDVSAGGDSTGNEEANEDENIDEELFPPANQGQNASEERGIEKYNWGWYGGAGSGHEGIDIFSRNPIKMLYSAIEDGTASQDAKVGIEGTLYYINGTNIGTAVYNYELNRVSKINSSKAKQMVDKQISDETLKSPVVCSAPGIVVDVRYNATSGFRVKVQHEMKQEGTDKAGNPIVRGKGYSDGTSTFYMHMRRWPLVQVGDYVGAGTLLGYEGTTGASGTYHVHYEVRKNGNTAQDPTLYVFPIFNPFYNAEKYGSAPEYESLLRTVLVEGYQSVANVVPQKPLLEDISILVKPEAEEPYELPETKQATDKYKEYAGVHVKALDEYFKEGSWYEGGGIGPNYGIVTSLSEEDWMVLRNYIAYESRQEPQSIESYIALVAEVINRIEAQTGFNTAVDIRSVFRARNDYGPQTRIDNYYANQYYPTRETTDQAVIDEAITRAVFNGEDPTHDYLGGGATAHLGKGKVPNKQYIDFAGNKFYIY